MSYSAAEDKLLNIIWKNEAVNIKAWMKLKAKKKRVIYQALCPHKHLGYCEL